MTGGSDGPDPRTVGGTARMQPCDAGPRLDLGAVLRAAREAAALFTALPVDQIVSCTAEEGGWRVRLEVVEMKSRVGGNDLLSSYEVRLDGTGMPLSFERIGKAHRERAGEG